MAKSPKMKLLLVMVTVAWVWLIAKFGLASVCPLADKHELSIIETVTFNVSGATPERYTQLIEALRNHLATDYEVDAIPVLRDPTTTGLSSRFVYVQLSNSPQVSITLAIDLTNAYVVAFRTGARAYFFSDAPHSSELVLFQGSQHFSLPFDGSYTQLQRAADQLRENIDLGITPLENAVAALYSSSDTQQNRRARALLVCIQMISEASRFKYIEQLVRASIRRFRSFRPNPGMLSLETNWGRLSRAIQNAQQGVFRNPVRIQRPQDSSFVDLDTVTTELVCNLALLLYACRQAPQYQFSPLIRSVVEENDHDSLSACESPEPTVRISGRDGLCVDVRDGKYNDGNPIQLWPCRSSDDANQLWTLKRDRTIRSKGKCLTAYGFKSGQYVMIYNCTTAETGSTKWKVDVNGTILNPRSSLVLGATSGKKGTTLKVQTNVYAASQGWLASNNSNPLVTSIVGFRDLCLEASKNGLWVWLEECAKSKPRQKWALYPDGSIRLNQNRSSCLTNSDQYKILTVSCSSALNTQRWVFTQEGTILNLQKGLVVEVTKSDPSLRQIQLAAFNGKPNQKWLPLL